MPKTPKQYAASWNSDKSSVWEGWGPWVALCGAEFKKDPPPQEAGVYILAIQTKDGQRTIHRLLGDDKQGVLTIGEAKNLHRRLITLRNCVSRDNVTGHMAGWRFRNLQLQKKLDGTLVVAWATGRDHYKLEGRAMAHYLNAFGELPPLNYKANWSLVNADASGDIQPKKAPPVPGA